MDSPAGLDLRMIGEYMVAVDVRQTAWGEVTHLEVARADNLPLHRWYDLLNIKNEICGEERVAVEVYPAKSRLVDAQHAYHLWVLPEGFTLPFGIHELDNPEHEHCMHRQSDRVLTTWPAQYQKMCCCCGFSTTDKSPDNEPGPGPHGSFITRIPEKYRGGGQS